MIPHLDLTGWLRCECRLHPRNSGQVGPGVSVGPGVGVIVGVDVVEVSPPYDGPGQITALLAAGVLASIPASAQFRPRGPEVKSPEIAPDRKVTFRVFAERAEQVKLNSGDIPILPEDRNDVNSTAGLAAILSAPCFLRVNDRPRQAARVGITYCRTRC